VPDPTTSERPVVLHTRVVCGSGGGPDKTIFNSPRHLRPLGYSALCAYMHPPGDPGYAQLEAKATASGARLISVPDSGPCDWRVPGRLLDICRRERVTIWHAHDYKSNALGLLLRRRHPMRLVTTVHGWVKHTRRTPLYYWIDKLSLRRYERVICVSPDLHAACLTAGAPAERCVLIENAIDTVQTHRRRSPAEARALLDLPADRFLIGAVGRLSEEKGFLHLIDAVARLHAGGLPVYLVILGDGDQRDELAAAIQRLGCGHFVRLAGYQSDLAPWYEALDAFALSSLREGLPNVVLEAMALSTPVVATRIAGLPRLIDDGQNGLLVPPGDVAALSAALLRLADDPALRARLASAGRAVVENRYSFAVRMGKIRQVYDELLGRSSVAVDIVGGATVAAPLGVSA
jgi:glycosyltransferase involved in cell wall biosynthesis